MQTMRTASISLSTRCLFMWQLLTITRPAEAAEALWEEVDIEAREWKIPAARMKMNRDHTVPLSDEAIAILRDDEAVKWKSRIYLSQPHQAKPADEQSDRKRIAQNAQVWWGARFTRPAIYRQYSP